MTDFTALKLAAPVHEALKQLGYTTPTPIQSQSIPDVLSGWDLMGIAQTGTGKTAAFALPLLSHIAANEIDPPKRGTRALILAPTRELASQIAVSVRDYGSAISELRVACIFGGVPIHRQIKKLVRGNDVLVATPGRLIDLIDRKDIRLDGVEILVLDEADQMMDMGFIRALRKIMPHLPENRQTLFFSATMTPPIKKLAGQFLSDPVTVSVTPPNSTADKVEQSVIFIDAKQKQDLLALTLLDADIDRALVFTRTKHGADRVVKRLARIGIAAIAIHGNKSQSQRQRALAAFREGRIRILVATDIAARGIDIEGISHVINFEIPNVPEQYVHRIGRTARAGRAGRALSFVAPGDERSYLKAIEKLLKTSLPVEALAEDFNARSAEIQKRPPLPKPEGETDRPARSRPKRRKKPKTAEDPRPAEKTDGPESGKKPSKKRRQGRAHRKGGANPQTSAQETSGQKSGRSRRRHRGARNTSRRQK